ncbi:acyltransferase domain-containing protein [Brachybacterium sp. AOP25-B2-12]|uniref:acyltransferase domain-containing protein n=1 Tax=Brachybacterium sp. AOP25-B2-12 TaxID=3457710 RepID=UPI004033241D
MADPASAVPPPREGTASSSEPDLPHRRTREAALPRVEGAPPRALRSSFDLSIDAVGAMLTAPAIGRTAELLGITGIDHEELLAVIPRAIADPAILAAVTEEANLLRTAAGLDVPEAALGALAVRDDALQARVLPGRGLVPILAHLVSTDTVRAWHTARGLSAEESWGALADLGQQMRVHRLTYGGLGHHTLGWTALNWAGRLFGLGRLQFDLHRSGREEGPPRWVIGTHIPATGPLTPDAVDASFARASTFFTTHFSDLATAGPQAPFGREFTCTSWLVNDELPELVGADSNLGAFAARWSIERTHPGSDDAAFFVFHARPPYDAAAFPRTTRLERAVADRLRDGRGWLLGTGRLVI